jgi:hypothetical protein
MRFCSTAFRLRVSQRRAPAGDVNGDRDLVPECDAARIADLDGVESSGQRGVVAGLGDWRIATPAPKAERLVTINVVRSSNP